MALGFGPSWPKRSLIAARRELQTLNYDANRFQERIDLLPQCLEFGSSQIAAFEALFYLRERSLKISEFVAVWQLVKRGRGRLL